MLPGMATRTPAARQRTTGRSRGWERVSWLGAGVLAVALLGAAGAAEAYPLPGTALLLPTAAVCFRYRVRVIA